MIEMISKDEFKAFEKVRNSGVTNMFDVAKVQQLSGLNRETIFTIMKNYNDLVALHPEVRR